MGGGKAIPERKRAKIKGRRGSNQGFLQLFHWILDSAEFADLSAHAVKLLLELARQYRGNNNGDFQATWSLMKLRGWNSPSTLSAAKKELCAKGWAIVTRQGGRNSCSLYALTIWPVHECGGKHTEMPTERASNAWKKRATTQAQSTDV